MLKPGMTFTIEPMINEGTRHTKVLPDGWTVVTKDRKLSAQWEHTVAVTTTRSRSSRGCRATTTTYERRRGRRRCVALYR